MLRFTAFSSLLAAGLALAPAAFAQTSPPAPTFTPPIAAVTPAPTPVAQFPAAGDLAPAPAVNASKMAAAIRTAMNGNAFGYQFAIAQNGQLVPGNATTDKRAGGFARSDADNPNGGATPMTNTMRYEVASFTKNPVALSTMKLLRLRGLSIESPIAPWLPPTWARSDTFKAMKFRHLLGHTSGINQMLAAIEADIGEDGLKQVFNNNWEGLQWLVTQNPTLDSGHSYKNANYGLLGILNAAMWRASGGVVLGPGGLQPVNKQTSSTYAQQFLQTQILAPAGIAGGSCVGNSATDGLNYPAGATQSTNGSLGAWPALICAGNAGLRLSSTEMVRYLAHLRHGTIVHPDDLKTMDALRLGWSAKHTVPNPSATARWHGGAFNGTNQVWTCGMTFADGTEAALIVNSAMKTGDACDVLHAAWKAA